MPYNSGQRSALASAYALDVVQLNMMIPLVHLTRMAVVNTTAGVSDSNPNDTLNQQPIECIPEYIDLALKIAIPLFMAVVIGTILFRKRSNWTTLRNYRGFISEMIRYVGKMKFTDVEYDRSILKVEEIRRETSKIREILKESKIIKIDQIIDSYETVRVDGWAGPDVERQQKRQSDNRNSHLHLIECLNKIKKLAK